VQNIYRVSPEFGCFYQNFMVSRKALKKKEEAAHKFKELKNYKYLRHLDGTLMTISSKNQSLTLPISSLAQCI
jgi:hypothetical protein